MWSTLLGVFNVYHVWKTSQGAQEIPPDYDDKGELSPIPAMKGKSYDMSCSSDSLRSMRETRRDITRYHFSRIGIKLSESYHNDGV